MNKYVFLTGIVLLLMACALSQAATQLAPVETQAGMPTSIPTAAVTPSAESSPTPTGRPCTELGWADISTYMTEFQFQTVNFANGVIVSEQLKTLRSIREKVFNVAIDVCTEHARELVLSSMDFRTSAQEMMLTGKFNDPNAFTNALMQEAPLIEAARSELASLGLQVTLPSVGSVPVTMPSIPSLP